MDGILLLTLILVLIFSGVIAYLIVSEPHPDIEITPERRAEILKKMAERRARRKKKRL